MNLRIPRICWLAVFLLPIAGTSGAVIYVDGNSPGGDGSSWAEAYDSLQEALADANASPKPVEIRVAWGTYRPAEHNGERTAAFELINGATICGGYAGYGRPDTNARNVQEYETILSGDLNGDDDGFINNDENSYHVVYGRFDTNETAVLDGFTITAGNANGDSYNRDYGGGINNYGAPTVIDCTLVGNWARIRGGSMHNRGGYYIETGPGIIGCIFSNNYSADKGGGMYNKEISPRITGCTFSNNSAATDGGGMYDHHQGSILTNCVFAGNFAARGGGGIVGYDLYGGNLTITNCIIVGNEGSEYGGALMSEYSVRLCLTNTILWDNVAYEGSQVALVSGRGIAAFDYCCVQGGELDVFTGSRGEVVWGPGNIDTDPCFADPSAGDYHLKSRIGRWDPNDRRWTTDEATSPCIDAGDPDSDWTAELWPHGKRINMGAFGGKTEASMSLSNAGNIADLNNSDLADYADLMMFVNKWPYQEALLSEDIDRNGVVNFTDFAIFCGNWLWKE